MKIKIANYGPVSNFLCSLLAIFFVIMFSCSSMARGNDQDPCAKISIYAHSGKTDSPKNLRFDCYKKNAVAQKNASLCKKISATVMADCFSAVAVAKDDIDACMEIPVPLGNSDFRPRWQCLAEIAQKRKNPKLCDRIPSDFSYLWKYCRGE
jgi:hypothetical protein